MKFKSIQVTGKGRGKLLGYPTINLQIPPDFELTDGIYAVKVFIESKTFIGAMHYGPIPVFNEDKKTLEVFLVDTNAENIPDSKEYEVEMIAYLRHVLSFPTKEELVKQIEKDVNRTRALMNKKFQ